MIPTFTNKEQSEKLLALGLNELTADAFIETLYKAQLDDRGYIIRHDTVPYCEYVTLFKSLAEYGDVTKHTFMPCWSLESLLKLFPAEARLSKGGYDLENHKELPDMWFATYDGYDKDEDDCFKTFNSNNPFTATFELVCWLLENNIIEGGLKNEI